MATPVPPKDLTPPTPPKAAPPSAAPKAAPPPSPAPAQVNIHGIPPAPNMAPAADTNMAGISDSTREEMMAGIDSLDKHDARHNAEHEAGRKALERHKR